MQRDPERPAPQRLGQYQLIRPIGEGGMGRVYEAYHPGLRKRFALKTLLDTAAAQPDARARFLREAEAAARIDHPHVVHVTDVGSEGVTVYLVMEYLEGQTLAALLAERGRLDLVAALDLLLPVLAAVATAHGLGVIHRDLKPENIFLARTPLGELCPKVVDFGVSKLTDAGPSTLTGPQATLGTAAYMSPEQARGARDVGAASDQYSLGLILYEAITGRRAHRGQNALEILHNITRVAPPRVRHHQPDCPQGVENIVMRMLSPAAEYRFASVAQAGAALLEFADAPTRQRLAHAFDGVAVTGGPPPAERNAIRRHDATTAAVGGRQRRAIGVVLSLGLVLAGAGLLHAWLGAPVPPPERRPEAPATPPALAPVGPQPSAPDVQPLAVTPPSPAVEPPRPRTRRGGAVAAPAAGRAREKVFDPAQRPPAPKRGVNDALILD